MEADNISGTISDGWQEAYRMFENRLMGSLGFNCSGEHEAKAGSKILVQAFWKGKSVNFGEADVCGTWMRHDGKYRLWCSHVIRYKYCMPTDESSWVGEMPRSNWFMKLMVMDGQEICSFFYPSSITRTHCP